MPTYTVYFNPNWPDSNEHIQLGEPHTNREEAIDELRKAVTSRYGNTTRTLDEGTVWGSNLLGSVNMGKYGSHNHGYVNIKMTDLEFAENQVAAWTRKIETAQAEIVASEAARAEWQAKLDALTAR